jgi:acid phosphatase (class A)
VSRARPLLLAGSVAGLMFAAACAAQPSASTGVSARPPSLSSAGRLMSAPGFIPLEAIPDSRLLNPPPPAPGSPAEARDIAASQEALALRGTPRWALATQDAALSPTTAADTFSCAAGFKIGAETTPQLDALLMQTASTLGRSTSPTKAKYQRPRPFMVNMQPMCTPEHDAVLRHDGSYPSGHSALGFGWGLILAAVVPDRAAQLVARGRAFGDSRRVCNVHWLSDVEEGRVVAAAVVARLNAEPAFQAALAAARAEVGALTKRDPGKDCAVEAAVLGG